MAFYPTVVPMIPGMCVTVGNFIAKVVHQTKTSWSRFHMIGHSTGAQISGCASHKWNGKVGRITSLDPTTVGITLSDKTTTIDPSDADFVDVIHTSDDVSGKSQVRQFRNRF